MWMEMVGKELGKELVSMVLTKKVLMRKELVNTTVSVLGAMCSWDYKTQDNIVGNIHVTTWTREFIKNGIDNVHSLVHPTTVYVIRKFWQQYFSNTYATIIIRTYYAPHTMDAIYW
jgi:hypothetical protein